MKIAHITSYFPPHLGGAEQRIKDLSERLAKRKNNIMVFTSNIGCKKGWLKSKVNLKINYLKSIEFAHTPIIFSLFSELIKLPKETIMHVHSVDAFTTTIAFICSKLKKFPFIFHIRGNPRKSGFFGFLLPLFQKILLKKFLKNTNKIIALNEDYKKMFSEIYDIPLEKFEVIPNATNFRIVKERKIGKSFKNILFVGRLSVEKNVDLIIKAIQSFSEKNLKLYIAGDGEKKEELSELIKKLKLEKNVIFLGKLRRKKLYQRYLKSDLVLLPSEYECFSSVLLEAMATGTPIIASNIPGTRSIIKNNYNGLLVKPTSKEIAKAIEKLIKNAKLRERLAKNGLKEVKKYSWDKIVKQTERVYREVLKEHNKKLKEKGTPQNETSKKAKN